LTAITRQHRRATPDRRAAIAALRTSGFVADAEAHRRDLPRFCPRCGGDYGKGSVVVEYWQSANRVFYAACGHCGWSGDIVISPADGVEGFEPEH
jgi:hypothetical protein